MSLYVLLALVAFAGSLLLGGGLARLWTRHEQRATKKKWKERERLLDRRKDAASRHEVLRRRSRPGVGGRRRKPLGVTASVRPGPRRRG
ncbi:MAG: hypothetical protein WEG40_11905 [Candidatus Rokuibacteriota bacterium]